MLFFLSDFLPLTSSSSWLHRYKKSTPIKKNMKSNEKWKLKHEWTIFHFTEKNRRYFSDILIIHRSSLIRDNSFIHFSIFIWLETIEKNEGRWGGCRLRWGLANHLERTARIFFISIAIFLRNRIDLFYRKYLH